MKRFYLLFFIFIFGCHQSPIQKQTHQNRIYGKIAENGMVVTAHPLASKIGLDILKQGGNAYDAAIAVQFALSVCYPRAGNIGGGGFMVARDNDGTMLSLDFREKAPFLATENMYLDKNHDPIPNLSTQGYLAVGVPGTVAGMDEIHKAKGNLSWATLIQPAIDLAANGFQLTAAEANKLMQYQEEFQTTNSSNMPFLNTWQEGDTIKLPELAQTLRRIQENGKSGFYEGKTADIIVNAMEQNGGIISHSDLKSYTAKWRTPLKETINELTIISMPPPSSGGIALIQLLKGADLYNNRLGEHNATSTIHYYTELERRVYADRAEYLGDSDFHPVPVKKLMSSDYLQNRYNDIQTSIATKSSAIKQGEVNTIESIETTHFSIVDKEGNAVAITTTLNGNYGSKVFLSEGGFFLNNEMDDFSMKPGVPNMFGLVGSEANKIEPEKRMLSSMTPTIVEKNGELYMVVGTPGGSTIITSVFQTIMNVSQFGMTMQEAVNAKKTHHQWLPEVILVENGALTNETWQQLTNMGHKLEKVEAIGRIDAILVTDGVLEGAADPRGDDYAAGY